MRSKTPDEIQDALDSRYARFGLHSLTDEDVWALSMAAMVMPDGNPGAEAYLAKVAGTNLFNERLMMWGRVVAIGIAASQYKAPGGHRRVEYVPSYDESWGRYAVADGLSLALYGESWGLVFRSEQLGVGKQGYQRIRDFVGSALVTAIAEYQVALQWATGSRRDRVFAGRWEGATGVSWDDARAGAMLGHQDKYPMFNPGCGITPNTDHAYNPSDDSPPETLYQGLRATDWWSAGQARRTRETSPARTICPATDTNRLTADE